MLGVIDHPSLTNEGFTTVILSWFDGGLHFFEAPLRGSDGMILLETYYLAYFLVIGVGYVMARRWQAKGTLRIKRYQVYDMALIAIISVLLGAKFVYVVFYNWEFYRDDPWQIVTNWSGMASHGAALGVAIGIYIWTRRIKVPYLHVGDAAVFGGGMAAITVRTANFLNGELYGHSTDANLPWAMRFPMRDGIGRSLYIDAQDRMYAMMTHIKGEELDVPYLEALDKPPPHAYENFEFMRHAGYENQHVHNWVPVGGPKGNAAEVYRLVTDPSHPCQFYEFICGGIILLTVLFIVRCRAKKVGTASATFLIGYGGVRIIMEFFRQQDFQRSEGVFAYVSMGQMLSVGMIACGCFILWRQRKHPLLIADIPMPEQRGPQVPPATC